MDLEFNCPKCGQQLAAQPKFFGQLISCPECQERIEVPTPAVPGPGPNRTIIVRPHTPWSLMALGAVVILYAYDLPRRMNND